MKANYLVHSAGIYTHMPSAQCCVREMAIQHGTRAVPGAR